MLKHEKAKKYAIKTKYMSKVKKAIENQKPKLVMEYPKKGIIHSMNG